MMRHIYHLVGILELLSRLVENDLHGGLLGHLAIERAHDVVTRRHESVSFFSIRLYLCSFVALAIAEEDIKVNWSRKSTYCNSFISLEYFISFWFKSRIVVDIESRLLRSELITSALESRAARMLSV